MPPEKKPSPPRLRITRVYTRTGDGGSTRLAGGQSVPKDDPRIEAYGTVDELGVWMGQAREALARLLAEADAAPAAEATSRERGRALAELRGLAELLVYLQNRLFTLGGDLATRVENRWPNMPTIDADDVRHAERTIDAYNSALPPLTDFILAGGGPVSLALHGCRVVCRRAERRIRTLGAAEPIGDHALVYVNRLSDLFFVLARWVVAKQEGLGIPSDEAVWKRDLPRPAPPRRRG